MVSGSLNKILEKMGLYDLFVLLFTGFLIVSMTIFLNREIFHCAVVSKIQIEETIPFLLSSYLAGLCFHECSSILVRGIVLRDDNEMLKRMVSGKKKWQPYLAEIEEKDWTIAKWVFMYQVCKEWYGKNADSSRNERDQYSAGISRSLSLYFFIVAVVIGCISLSRSTWSYCVYLFISLVLSVVLYYRFERYTYMRYIRIIRAYLYGVCLKENNDGKRRDDIKVVVQQEGVDLEIKLGGKKTMRNREAG